MNGQYRPLALTFLKIGLFGFGGGYAILPLISHEVVDAHGWATSGEFADMVALSQMTPGPVAINAATYVGFTNAGVAGSVIATLAFCLPPFVLMYLACLFLTRLRANPRVAGAMRLLRPAVVGLVLAAALVLMDRHNFVDGMSGAVFAAALVLTLRFKVHPIMLLAGAGVFGWLYYGVIGAWV